MNKKILLIITIVLSFLAISCGNKNTDPTTDPTTGPTIKPPTKEEVVKFQGTWGGLLNYKSGDIPDKSDLNVIFTINADGSIKDEDTQQTIALDKINKVSDNVFEFTSEVTEEGAKSTLKHKVDFTDNNAPKDTFVCTMEYQGQSYSATYEGTLSKQTQKGVKFQGTWGGEVRKSDGDTIMPESTRSEFTINADGSIKDNDTKQTIPLDKINKVSDNVFEFTSKKGEGRTILTLKHKVDFTDNNAPKDTVVVVLTIEAPVESYSATYKGTLKKQP